MFSICVIGVYFGKLPEYFNLWLKSCERNREIDFLIVTDNEIDNLPENVKCIKMNLPEMKELADRKLGLKTALNHPYKCCDFKTVYGIIFEDYVKGYDFWGHCDFDLIFGNIRGIITEEILTKYDRVYDLGHLSLYRNTSENNNRHKAPGSLCGDYKTVFTSEDSFTFDELAGVSRIYKVNNFPMYDELTFADITPRYKRFKLSQNRKNYIYQTFYVENGNVYRTFYKNNKAFTEEYCYIHFQKRGFNTTLSGNVKNFYVCPQGFVEKRTEGVPTIDDIKRINPFTVKQESIDNLKRAVNFIKRKIRGLKRRIKKVLKKGK